MPFDIPPPVALIVLVTLVAVAAFTVSVAVGLLLGRSGVGDLDDRPAVSPGVQDRQPKG
jgi:hypothetical protein